MSSVCISCMDIGLAFNVFETHHIDGLERKYEPFATMLKECFCIEIDSECTFNAACAKCILKLGDIQNFKQDIIKNMEEIHRLTQLQLDYLDIQSDRDINSDCSSSVDNDEVVRELNVETGLGDDYKKAENIIVDKVTPEDGEQVEVNTKVVTEFEENKNVNADHNYVQTSDCNKVIDTEIKGNGGTSTEKFPENLVSYNEEPTTRFKNKEKLNTKHERLVPIRYEDGNIVIDATVNGECSQNDNAAKACTDNIERVDTKNNCDNMDIDEDEIEDDQDTEISDKASEFNNVNNNKIVIIENKLINVPKNKTTCQEYGASVTVDKKEIKPKSILKNTNPEDVRNMKIEIRNVKKKSVTFGEVTETHYLPLLEPEPSVGADEIPQLPGAEPSVSTYEELQIPKTPPSVVTDIKPQRETEPSVGADKELQLAGFQQNKCTECGKEFSCFRALRRHMDIHLSGPFACTKCDKLFDKLNTRNAHFWRAHTPQPYACTLCPERFSSYHRRFRHMQEKHGAGGNMKYRCEQCEKTFGSANSRWKHTRLCHTRGLLRCASCPMVFHMRRDLLRHMAAVHKIGNLPHQCPACKKRYFEAATLSHHMKTHVMPEMCPICAERFKYKAVLKCHVKMHHGIANGVHAHPRAEENQTQP